MEVRSDDREQVYRFWLDRMLPAGRIRLLRQKEVEAGSLFYADRAYLKALQLLTEDQIEKLLDPAVKEAAEGDWLSLAENGITFLSMDDARYPKRLRQIIDPPYALYIRGELPDPGKKAVAIVGARGRSDYGSSVARKLAGELALRDVPVISGLALGIDADAHMGCLAEGGMTYGILGCGADLVYPKQNRFLYEKMIAQGGVISEFPPGTPPKACNFPRRNRIISALSDLVCVCEARLHSGSLITADYALEQGKEVWALPGRITDPLSQGTNRLISQGAVPLISIEDFLDRFQTESIGDFRQLDLKEILMNPEEQELYGMLDFVPKSLAELLDLVPCGLVDLLNRVEELKKKGFIRETHPNYFVRNL